MLDKAEISNIRTLFPCVHFCSSKSLKKLEKIKQKTLKIRNNNFTTDYNQLLNKSSKVFTEVKRLRNLALEIFKTLNHMNPDYTKDIFHKTADLTNRTKYSWMDQVKFVEGSLLKNLTWSILEYFVQNRH